jgi:hypothetical protein
MQNADDRNDLAGSSVDDELIVAPRFAGVPQNVDEILSRDR